MAQVETNMYLQQQAPDIAGGIASGLKLKDMIRQNKIADQAQDFQNTLKTAYTADPTTGALTFDKSKLGDLAQIDAQKAYGLQQQQASDAATMRKQQLEDFTSKAKVGSQLLMTVNDDASYQAARPSLIQHGIYGAQELPQTYDPNWVKQHQQIGLDAVQQLDQVNKKTGFGIQQQEADAKTKEADTGAKKIPIEQQKANAEIQANSLKRDEMKNNKSNDANYHTVQMLESARGNPEVSQALKDRYAAQKLNTLIPADPNNMSPQQVQMAASEIGKLTTGGIPTNEELRHLNPATIPSGLASLAQYVTNNPQSAQAGEFVKQYKAYADAIANDANSVIKNKYSNVIEAQRGALGEEKYGKLKNIYLDPFEAKQAAAAVPKAPKVGTVEEGHVFLGGNPADPKSWKAK